LDGCVGRQQFCHKFGHIPVWAGVAGKGSVCGALLVSANTLERQPVEGCKLLRGVGCANAYESQADSSRRQVFSHSGQLLRVLCRVEIAELRREHHKHALALKSSKDRRRGAAGRVDHLRLL